MLFIEVYNADGKIAHLSRDLDLMQTYTCKAIDKWLLVEYLLYSMLQACIFFSFYQLHKFPLLPYTSGFRLVFEVAVGFPLALVNDF